MRDISLAQQGHAAIDRRRHRGRNKQETMWNALNWPAFAGHGESAEGSARGAVLMNRPSRRGRCRRTDTRKSPMRREL